MFSIVHFLIEVKDTKNKNMTFYYFLLGNGGGRETVRIYPAFQVFDFLPKGIRSFLMR